MDGDYMALHRIGIVTSGGDCGGLNAVIKGAAGMGNHLGIETAVIPNGYTGLYNLEDFEPNSLVVLTPLRLSQFGAHAAGSEAGHSRVKISSIKDTHKYERIQAGCALHSIDAIIVSGGDDSGSVAQDLADQGLMVNHVPKTMDLDLQPYSVGADSTANNIAEMAGQLRTTGETHNRIIVLEVFGRHVGHSAFRGGVAADADCILIPEIIPDFDIVYEHFYSRYTERIRCSDVHAGWYLIVAAEAMKGDPSKGDSVDSKGFLVDPARKDAFGHYTLIGAGACVEHELTARMQADPKMKVFMQEVHCFVEEQNEIPEVRVIRPTHLVRCGSSSAYDANFGREAGASAMLLLSQGISGVTVVGFSEGIIRYMPIGDAIRQRSVSLDQVALHEATGICFGRANPTEYAPKHIVPVTQIDRHL